MATTPEKPANAPTIDRELSFEAALAELESIVAAMETGQLPLQEALDAYQRGVGLLRHCRDTLGAAEQQIRILEGENLRDFDAGAAAEG